MANFIVTTLRDESDSGASAENPGGTGLSLREAIALANASGGADTITFAQELSGLVRLSEGEIEITDAVTIDGGGVITISGDANGDDATANGVTDLEATSEAQLNDNTRIFNISDDASPTTLSGLTLTGGRTANDLEGGGAVASQSNLTITDSVISGNSTQSNFGDGGAVYSAASLTVNASTVSGNRTEGGEAEGGALRAVGAITLTDVEISGNSTAGANSEGGAVFGTASVTVTRGSITGNGTTGTDADGGGVYALGALTVTGATVAENETSGPGSAGGGIYGGSSINVTDSTINDNTTTDAFSEGGGIAGIGPISITNSTISGNVTSGNSSEGGGVFATGAVSLDGVTVSGNRTEGGASNGGGVFGSSLNLASSIVLGNTTTAVGLGDDELGGDAAPGFTSPNIVGADAAAFDASVSGDVENADPTTIFAETENNASVLAGVLADNGGPVETIALQALGGGLAGIGAEAINNVTPPSITTSSVVNVTDGETDVIDVNATDAEDAEGAGLSYSLSGGDDQAFFSIDATSGALSFNAAPDVAAPADDDGDNVYEVEVTVTDSDGLTDSKAIDVTVFAEGALNVSLATEGNDTLEGTPDRDVIDGLGGRDRISGFQERDTLFGGDGNDTLRGGIDNDRLRGGDDDDVVRGQGGNDRLFGQAGDDNLIGANGEDTLKGGSGDDRLVGGGADDRLFGGIGDDTLSGLAGEDRIVAGAGNDSIAGGTGADRFIFRQNVDDDVIVDFEDGIDLIRVQNVADSIADLTITQVGNDALIEFTGTTVTLRNFDADDLSGADFLF